MFTEGQIIWAKASAAKQIFWPAKVIADFDPSMLLMKKKPVIACVEFLMENYFEAITKETNLQPFNCDQKFTFMQKGREHKNPTVRLLFDSAVKQAEQQIKRFPEKGIIGFRRKSLSNVEVEHPFVVGANKGPIKIKRTSIMDVERKNAASTNHITKSAKRDSDSETWTYPKRLAKSPDEALTCRKEDKCLSKSGGEETEGFNKNQDKVPIQSKLVQSEPKIAVKSTTRYTRRHTDQRVRPFSYRIKRKKRKTPTENLLKRFETASTTQDTRKERPSETTNTAALQPEKCKQCGKKIKPNSCNSGSTSGKKRKNSTVDDPSWTKIKAPSETEKLLDEQRSGAENTNPDLTIDTPSSDDDDLSLPEAFSPGPEQIGPLFHVGDIVWAKYPQKCAPFWPGQITRVCKANKQLRHYCCFLPLKRFPNGLRVNGKTIQKFTCNLKTMETFKNQTVPDDEKDDFEAAIKEAEDILVRRAFNKPNNDTVLPEDSEDEDTDISDNEKSAESMVEEEKTESNQLDDETEEDIEKCSNRFNEEYKDILTDFDCCKDTLLDIFQEKIPSVRHNKFCGSVSEKNSLKHSTGFGPIQDEEVLDQLIKKLKLWYGEVKQNFIQLDYILEVWLPEAILFFIKKYENVSSEKAEKILLDHESNIPKNVKDDVKLWFKTRKIDEDDQKEALERARRIFQVDLVDQ